jgi:recombination protein RecA
MARKKEGDITPKNKDEFSELAKVVGGQVLRDVDPVRYFIDTGSLAMNAILSGKFIGGGIPGGKITEILGPSSSGKSLWAMNVLRGTQKINGIAVYLDVEDAVNREFASQASHIDLNKIIRFEPQQIPTLEMVFRKIHAVIKSVRERFDKSRPLVIVYDSISASSCDRELRENDLSENHTDAEWKRVVGNKEQPGERARVCNRELRKIIPVLEANNSTLFITNQIRKKINGYGEEWVPAGGGAALEFYAGVRIRTLVAKKIENKAKSVIGVNLNARCMKNRYCAPFKQASNIQLFFEKGINPIGGLLSVFLAFKRVEVSGKGIYTVNKFFTGGEEVKFRASKERNEVPIEVMLKCPALLDVENASEIEEYLSVYEDVLNESSQSIEKDIANDDLDDSDDNNCYSSVTEDDFDVQEDE